MSHIRKVIAGLKPAFLMVVVQVSHAGVSILYKLVANDGMSLRVLLAYRFLFASAFLVPLAYLVERKSKPKITAGVLFEAFLCGLFGASLQESLFVEAVALATATYATAMYNLIPGVTFILAVCFGLESLNIRKSTGKAKVLGTLMGIGGAMIFTFYTSIEIHIWSTRVNLMHHLRPHDVATVATQIWGSALAFGTCLSCSMWLIIQARMSAKFPWHYTSTALMSVMAAIQSITFALCVERDWSQWKLGCNIRLLAIVYTGVVASGLVWVLVTWCVRLKGPLYTSIFNPLFLVVVAIAGSLLLDERLYVGSVIGSLLIVLGLYIVLWGKGKELKRTSEQTLIKGSREVEKLEIVTTNHADGKSVENDIISDIKSAIITPSCFTKEIDNLSKEGKEENERKDNPILTIKESKHSA